MRGGYTGKQGGGGGKGGKQGGYSGQSPNQPSAPQIKDGDSIPEWKKKLLALPIDDQVCDEALIQKVIRYGGKLLVSAAEELGFFFSDEEKKKKEDRLTTSQIRNIFGMVKKMELSGFDANEFVLLRPKLAYAAARAKAEGTHQFAQVLTWAIKEVDADEKKFARFVDFFEAILAYHKAAGGK